MKKVVPNGQAIKALRMNLEKGATQIEFAHSVRISERKLRQIENQNAPVTIDIIERMAKTLNVHRERIIAGNITVPLLDVDQAMSQIIAKAIDEMDHDRLIPRFDEDLAYVVKDENELFTEAERSEDSSFQIMTELTSETKEYAEELADILTSLTGSCKNIFRKSVEDELAVRQRIRQLLVLLKGNDVWVYMTSTLRRLPESSTPMPEGEYGRMNFRLVIAFGPPGEYGETSVRVAVDHGQPFILPGWPKLRKKLETARETD